MSNHQQVESAAITETQNVVKETHNSHQPEPVPASKRHPPDGCKLQFSLPAPGVCVSAESPLARERRLNPRHEQGTADTSILLWAWALQTSLSSAAGSSIYSHSGCGCRRVVCFRRLAASLVWSEICINPCLCMLLFVIRML